MFRNTRRRFLKQTAALGIGMGVSAAPSGRAGGREHRKEFELPKVVCDGVDEL